MSRLSVSKPLFIVLGVAFSGSAYANAQNDWAQSRLTCHNSQTNAARYAIAPAQTSGGETLPENATRITADFATGQTNAQHHAKGNVIVERNGETLNADWVNYDQKTETVQAGDQFTLTRQDGQSVRGEKLDYHLNDKQGTAENAEFEAQHNGRRLQGVAQTVEMQDENHSHMTNVKFNTCGAGDHSWYIQAAELKNNQETGIGVAKKAKLVFGGVPVLYTPWADFPTRGNRKSGLLVPTLKVGSDGTELEAPYYLNLAPNYDATITPSVITARGAAIGGEFRYLNKKYSGSLKGRYMPHDRRSSYNNRYETSWQHIHEITSKLQGGIDFNYVSDNDYYRDFYGRNEVAENVNLNRSAWLNYKSNNVWGEPINTRLTVQKYQTLPDSSGNKDKPYAILPDITSTWQKTHGKATYNFNAQLTRFEHDTKQSGTRLLAYPSVKWDFSNRWGYIRPKVGVHATQYWLNKFSGSNARNETRVLPIVNVDTGMTFERQLRLSGRTYIQTLEPRLFYNYITAKAQNHLPNFDSATTDFSYQQLFMENVYSGNDRINNSNSLAAGLQTRIINSTNGAERFRAGIGQKIYFNTDSVLLNGNLETTPRKRSDLAAFAFGQIQPNWYLNGNAHYNEDSKQIQSWSAGIRYNPTAGKVVSARFKYGRREEIYTGYYDKLKQIDVAMQYPLKPNLYAVGRLNYSISPKTTLEQMFGLEYKNPCGCWSASLVAQRYITGLNQHKNAIYFTLQLRDLSNIGSSTYEKLRLGIPGYHKTNNVHTQRDY